MPRFFFHSRNQDQTHLDPDGAELPSLTMAMAEAVLSAREMMADELRRGPLTLGRSFDIADEDGHVLTTIAFHDCLYQAPSRKIER
jgi:hypothetical protein